jgi:glycerol-3-phosphate acyltransferase PlsY
MTLNGPVGVYFLPAYLVGSIPTGTIAARLQGKGSLFAPGERSPLKAGEVFEILGIPVGLLVTFLDFLKGLIVVWPLHDWLINTHDQDHWWVVSVGAFLVVFGHCNSAWLGFKGGRGLSTTFGVMMYLLPVPAVLAFLLWGCLAFWGLSTRPGALSAAGAMPLLSLPYVWWFRADKFELLMLVALLSLLTLWEYRAALLGYLGLPKKPSLPPSDSATASEQRPDHPDTSS